MHIGGADGWATGPDNLDSLCNTLYGNSTYGIARNMKIEDVNRVLGYTGPKGMYWDADYNEVTTDEPMTFGAIETKEGVTISSRETPRLSTTEFEDYLSDYYYYTGTTYKGETTEEYKVIFKKADGVTNLPGYLLSSVSACIDYSYVPYYTIRLINYGGVREGVELWNGAGAKRGSERALRPVIVLNSNIQFGKKNSRGELTLVEM